MIDNTLYEEDLTYVANLDLPWEKLKDSSILISGSTGQFGAFLVDVIMKKNLSGLNCKILAIGRNKDKAKKLFSKYDSKFFCFIVGDINFPLCVENVEQVDYVLHLASNTHPIQYASDPIGTITTNIIGLKNMLDFSVGHHVKRFAFASSNEVYGENRGDVEKFDEHYCGYIDCNTMRAGYPESKRCGEALCQAYIKQEGLDIVIPRFTRSFGPTLQASDTKAASQFIHKAISGEDIVLKSAGTQFYSYTYTADAIAGLLFVLLKGEKGNAYNIASEKCDIMLKDLAAIIAKIRGRNVVFELPDEIESSGYSKATKARLDSNKLEQLGWEASYSIEEAVERTIKALETNMIV